MAQIEISEHDLQILSHWASVNRTFNNIEYLISSGNRDESRIQIALDELDQIQKPIENLFEKAKNDSINDAWK